MGYAIKLYGVSAPSLGLGRVTFVEDYYNVIANAFFAQLSNATQTEQDACLQLIKTLCEYGVYNKFKLMLPMIGASVQDKLRDVVDPTDNSLYTKYNNTEAIGNFSVGSDNTLQTVATSSKTISYNRGTWGSTPFSIIGSYKTSNPPGATSLMAGTYNVDTNVNGAPRIDISGTYIPTASIPSLSGNTSFVDVVSYNGTTAKIYHKGEQIASVDVTSPLSTINITRLMSYSAANWTFLGFAEQLTAEEVTIVTNAILKFNTALNRVV